MTADTPPDTISSMQDALDDPAMRAQMEAQLAQFTPYLERMDELMRERDYVTLLCLNEMARFACDLSAHIGAPFDPMFTLLLLQRVGAMMANQSHEATETGEPDPWAKYTAEAAPRCNAQKLRHRRATDEPGG